MAAAAAAHGGGLDQFSHSFPNLGNCHLFKHGCFRIQITLRQLGCGNGKNWGAYSENAWTVSDIEAFRFDAK
jgi:hypothetical protein